MCQVPTPIDLVSIFANPSLPAMVGNVIQVVAMFDEYERQEADRKAQYQEHQASQNADQTAILALFRLYQQGKLPKATFLQLVGEILPNDVDIDLNQLAMILNRR